MTSKRLSPGSDLLVDTEGGVYLKNGEVKHQFVRNGYLVVKRLQKTLSVHRLVAKAFIPNPGDKSDVNHIDGNKTNNSVSNLEWATRSENLYHALRNGLHDNPEKRVIGVSADTGIAAEYCSEAEAARATGAYQGNISKCLSGLRNTAGGFSWSFV